MTTYFVSSGGDNSDGLTWAKAYTSLQTALTAASSGTDIVVIQYNAVPSGDAEVSADTGYTTANHVLILSASNDGGSSFTLTAMGTANWIGNSSTNYRIGLNCGADDKVYCYGLTFRVSGSTADELRVGGFAGTAMVFDNCYFWQGNTASSGSNIVLGNGATESTVICKDCTLRFGAAGNLVVNNAQISEFYNCTVSADGTAPSILINPASLAGIAKWEGCDLSHVTGTLVGNTGCATPVAFINCKLGSGVTVLATQTSNPNRTSAHVSLYNCSSGDQHYHFGDYSALGSTIVDTGIYANDGAQYDGTNYCSWKIVTTANCSYYDPYVTPWIDCYHTGTSEITPYLEILRSGSATAYQNDEVWGEFSYQGTSGFPLGVLVNDRMALFGTPADQTTGALDASGWTGENATSWFGKLNPTSAITPAEIGHLRARVCVGEPEITVYVDPTIRGRS